MQRRAKVKMVKDILASSTSSDTVTLMGLGPALCLDDQVLAEKHILESGRFVWRCPICHSTKLGSTGLGDNIPWKLYEDNLKFWKFVDGKDPGHDI